jgi:hypothetical protein
MRDRLFKAAALVLGRAGCATVGPDYQHPLSALPATFSTAGDRVL